MRKVFNYLGILILIFFVIIQFFRIKKNEYKPIDNKDFIQLTQPPLEISKYLKVACYDCHSNRTKYPWYAEIQPFAWLLNDHIQKGKIELNFSEFGDYSSRKQLSKMESIIGQIENNQMPLKSYLWLHSEAKLDEISKKTLLSWLEKIKNYEHF